MNTFVGIALLMAAEAHKQACVEYICDPPDIIWTDWICGMEKPYNSSQFALRTGACASGEICELSAKTNAPAECKWPDQVVGKAFPGEPCNDIFGCYVGNCTDGFCPSGSVGDECRSWFDCGVDGFCYNNVCIALVPVGGNCTGDHQCVQNAGCDYNEWNYQGVCVEYLSLPPKAQVRGCTPGYGLQYYPMCASTLCYLSNFNDSGFCADFVQSAAAIPTPCEKKTCASTQDPEGKEPVISSCQCGSDARSYCSLFPGDTPMHDYLQDMQQYLNSSSILQCSNARKSVKYGLPRIADYLNNACALQLFTPSQEMLLHSYYYNNFLKIETANECALQSLFPQYYNLTRQLVPEQVEETPFS